MIRRLRIEWPDPRPFERRGGTAIRLLAVSDEPERALTVERNRSEIGPIDGVLGCGDLDPEWLAFLGDAFGAPLLYVRGNHDRGAGWRVGETHMPEPMRGRPDRLAGIRIVGLEWPGVDEPGNGRHDRLAWCQAFGVARRQVGGGMRRDGPLLVISHAPPAGVGDAPGDAYHVGFGAYRWLLGWCRPPVWLHGHTPMASTEGWRVERDGSAVVNVTGAVLLELTAYGRVPLRTAAMESQASSGRARETRPPEGAAPPGDASLPPPTG